MLTLLEPRVVRRNFSPLQPPALLQHTVFRQSTQILVWYLDRSHFGRKNSAVSTIVADYVAVDQTTLAVALSYVLGSAPETFGEHPCETVRLLLAQVWERVTQPPRLCVRNAAYPHDDGDYA